MQSGVFWIVNSLPPGKFFRKILLGKPSKCQTDWFQIRLDQMSGLLCVESFYKGYEQMALGGKGLIATLDTWKC